MITCDCEVYEICPSCAPSEPAYAKAAEFYNEAMQKVVIDDQRQQLEHSLATAFVTLQRERVPERRQELWGECLRLAKEIENLNGLPALPE